MENYVWIIFAMWLFAFVLILVGLWYLYRSFKYLNHAEINVKVRELEGYMKQLKESLRKLADDKANVVQSLKQSDKRSEAEKQLVINEPESSLLTSMTQTQTTIGKEYKRALEKLMHQYNIGGTRGGNTAEIHEIRASKKIAMAAIFFASTSIVIGAISWLTTWILQGQ